MTMGAYPPGVTDADIDRYFGVDEKACWKYCTNYVDGSCFVKEHCVEADHTVEELEVMSQEEYDQMIATEEDDYCDDYECRDNSYDEFWWEIFNKTLDMISSLCYHVYVKSR